MKEDGNYFVGGFVRDIYLNKEKNFDIDIAVKDINGALNYFKREMKGNIITLDEDFGVYRVFIKGFERYLDISKLQGADIIEDLQRRDFSVNATAIKIRNREIEIIDPLEGFPDIEKKIIRAISRENLVSDPLRLLRAYRFKAQLNFEIEDKTKGYIKELSFLTGDVAKERLKAELFKILSFRNTEKIFRDMDESNLLKTLFPFMESYKNFYSGKLHKYDLFNHSLETLRIIETFNDAGFPLEFDKNILSEELEHGFSALSALKLTALLHDTGKILTKKVINNKITFYKHDEEGSNFLKNFLIKEKFSSKSVNFIEKLIKLHLYPFHIIQSSKENLKLSPKAYFRLNKEVGPFTALLFVLFIADNLAKDNENSSYLITGAKKLYEDYLNFDKKNKEKQPLLNGSDIMEILKLEEGPLVGKIITDIKELELEGRFKDKRDAIDYIREAYGKKI
ncbi:MAG: HD domain-containing protein [Proteobacteria bacterium]|nr:HD domain-containing protein [Pseudomonadota bacterium]